MSQVCRRNAFYRIELSRIGNSGWRRGSRVMLQFLPYVKGGKRFVKFQCLKPTVGCFDRRQMMGDNWDMSVDPDTIALTDAQRRALAELSDKTGKPWPTVLSEALTDYQSQARGEDQCGESFSAAAERLGLVGCIEGPADLSTNRDHMQGFGKREK